MSVGSRAPPQLCGNSPWEKISRNCIFPRQGSAVHSRQGKRTSCREEEALPSMKQQAARVCETWLVPYWPQFYYDLCIGTRTQAYLEKGLGADFYKLPRAKAMRTLSEVRKSIVWILKLLFDWQLQSCTERIRLSVLLCWVPSFIHRGVSVEVKNVPDRLRYNRALLQSKDLSMWFLPSLVIMVPQAWPQFWGNNPWEKMSKNHYSPSLGSGVFRRRRKWDSFEQEEATSCPVFGSLYLEGMG